MNAAIYIIDADVAILVTLFIFVYALLAIAIYIFGKVGFKAELTRYALEVADTEAAMLNELEVPYAIVDEKGNIYVFHL